MKRLLLILGVILTCTCIINAQQKAMYSQYMFNGLALNPAYSATDEALTVTALSRHQWVGFEGAPNTQTFSVHTPVKESNTSIGALLIRDQIGEVLSEKGAYLTVAHRVAVNYDSYLALGINGGISFNHAAFSDNYKESPSSVNDPVFQNSNTISGNFGFGVMYFSDNYYVGVSSPHIFFHNFGSSVKLSEQAIYRPHYILQGGVVLPMNDELKFKPNFLVKYVNGSPVQFDVNANLLIKETLWLGASYRSLDSFDFLAQLYLTPNIALGYSYDLTTTELARIQKGSHEVMLQFRLAVKGRSFPRCYF